MPQSVKCAYCGNVKEQGEEYLLDRDSYDTVCDEECWKNMTKRDYLDEVLDEFIKYRRKENAIVTACVGVDGY